MKPAVLKTESTDSVLMSQMQYKTWYYDWAQLLIFHVHLFTDFEKVIIKWHDCFYIEIDIADINTCWNVSQLCE